MTESGVVFRDEASCQLAAELMVAELVNKNEFLSHLARETFAEEVRAASEWFANGGTIND